MTKLNQYNSIGIYKIFNRVNGKIYIGSTSQSFSKRWNKHKSELNRNIHSNIHLQSAWNLYGKDNFDFIILEEINDISVIIDLEQKYIDELKPEYNICKIAGSTQGLYLSNEVKQKISDKLSGENNPMFGKNHTKETKFKMKQNHADVRCEKHSRAKLTQKQVDEIVQLKINGIKQVDIAKMYNVTKDTISRIFRGCTNWQIKI